MFLKISFPFQLEGADIANIVNTAAVRAATKGIMVSMDLLRDAQDDTLIGPERKTMVMKSKEKEMTAYHEAGHALVNLYSNTPFTIRSVTIVPRGNALGYVFQTPEADSWLDTKQDFLAHVAVALGGRAAEELVYGPQQITAGAGSDLEQATSIVKNMVMKYGMSESIGFTFHADLRGQKNQLSEKTKQRIDNEVSSILQQQYVFAKQILTQHEKEHHLLAKALLEYETLTLDELKQVIKGKKLNRPIIDTKPSTETLKPHDKKEDLILKKK